MFGAGKSCPSVLKNYIVPGLQMHCENFKELHFSKYGAPPHFAFAFHRLNYVGVNKVFISSVPQLLHNSISLCVVLGNHYYRFIYVG